MEATNTLEFCTRCHEMRDNVYQEYKKTIHYSNRTGVRAICSDCHVPKDWVHKIARKMQATTGTLGQDLRCHRYAGKIRGPPDGIGDRRWEHMKATDSRECRNCHSFEAMDARKQRPKAQEIHAEAQKEGKTCIDCHKGIAHLLPKEYNEDEE